MVLRLVFVLWLGCLTAAGPVAWDDSICAQECSPGSKYQYSEDTSYIYSYESSNELHVEDASDLSLNLKATVHLTAKSKCEMILQLTDVTVQHGTSSLAEQLMRNPLPFSFNDGLIDHICPNPQDSDDVNNIKRGILSSIQNTMKRFNYHSFQREKDILGTCDTEYKVKEENADKFVIEKNKHIGTCSNRLKGQSLLLASSYESATFRQNLPFFSNEKVSCTQTIDNGIVDEVVCSETAKFNPLTDYGFVIQAVGNSKLKKLSSGPAVFVNYKTPIKESLTFKHDIRSRKDPDSVSAASDILRHICQYSNELLSKDAATYVHKLVYIIRQLDEQALESLYVNLKSKQLCTSGKALPIYLDALKAASSGGSIALLTKLAKNGELSGLDSKIWLTLLPFTSYVEEESIAAALPLLGKEKKHQQALLGISALAYKFCSSHQDCESNKAIQDLSSRLKEFLGDKCRTSSADEEWQVTTALKAFGNLGYFGQSANELYHCANQSSNANEVRIAAIEAFRRTPCSKEVRTKLLDIYNNINEEDEIRIAALISLSRCATPQTIRNVLERYSSEPSKQVEVFTWSYIENLKSSSDPLKVKLREVLLRSEIKAPFSADVSKFSRNFEWSFFSNILNLGHVIEGNIIHSRNSFLPRSGNLDLKANLFGNQLDIAEVGGRLEDLEYVLEKLFGPRGLMPNLEVSDILSLLPKNEGRKKRAADSYKSKIDSLGERLGYKRNKIPHGSTFIRILGHELDWTQINEEFSKQLHLGSIINHQLNYLANLREIDNTKNLLFLDVSVLFPSVTGRAYKLAANGSLTLGIKSDGKVDIRQQHLPFPRAHIDSRLQPSILGELSASFTLHSEDYEPGVKVETAVNAGLDFQTTFILKDKRILHIKLNRVPERSEIFSLKRRTYTLNQRGKVELPTSSSLERSYCTKYVQQILGARYCGSFSIAPFPHIFNAEGKLKLPFVRSLDAAVVVEKTDISREGIEFLLELPDFENEEEKAFKLLFQTIKATPTWKLSTDFTLKSSNDKSSSLEVKVETPYYNANIDGKLQIRDDLIRLNVEALGDNTRRYVLTLDVGKDIRGSRLIEYQPRLSLTLPYLQPMEFSGTVVFSRGRKEQITINMQSSSFRSPFTIKGNLAKEGEVNNLQSDWKLNSEFNINAFSQIHRIQGSFGNEATSGLFLDLGHHYEPDGRSYESITVNAKLNNIEFRDRLGFSLDAKILLAEHQDLNTMLKWDFSFKPLYHLKNDITFRYGENFEDDTHLVRIIQKNALHGDFDSFSKMHIENEIGLTISCLDIDTSAAFTSIWDFVEKPKLILNFGIKVQKEKQSRLDFSYKHLSSEPLKIATEITVLHDTYILNYRDQLVETAPGKYEGKIVAERSGGKQVTIDYTYIIKSESHFHHELNSTINFPGISVPVMERATLEFTADTFHFNSFTDTGKQSPFELDIKLERGGTNTIFLNSPYVDGNVLISSQAPVRSIQADINFKKDGRRILVTGSLAPGGTNVLDLNVQWDADNDSEQKLVLNAKSYLEREDDIEKYMITATMNYVGAINVDLNGKLSTDLLRGPHYFKAEFSGNMEPMALELSHEIKDRHLTSVARYLRSGSEKLRSDFKGKFIQRANHFEIEAGAYLSSPFKTFDGREIYFRIMADSNEATRDFIAEYRIRPMTIINYVAKIDYQRKRGWPGQIRSNLIVSQHQKSIYEGSTAIDYGNGKYTWKTVFTPFTKRKINFVLSFEHAARFAAFHHSMSASLQYLQSLELNAVADLRNSEDAKIESKFDVNNNKLYEVKSTLKARSIIDFEGEIVLFSKITPSLHVFSKTQTSGEVTKYEFNIDVDSSSIVTGSGELKKRKKGFNSEMFFKYKEKEFLTVTVNQEAKSQRERNYLIKVNLPSRSYTSNVRFIKGKKGNLKYETKLCRNENDNCISIDVQKEPGEVDKWILTYKRADVEFSVERIQVSTNELSRFHTVIFKGDTRYGYDLQFGKEKSARSIRLGIILPSREIVAKGTFELSFRNPKAKLELATDVRNHPDRNLIVDLRFENHLRDDNPSKLDIIISHEIFEKPIEIELIGDLQPSSNKFFIAKATMDYSNNPEDKIIGKLFLEKTEGRSGNILLNVYHQDEQHLDFVMKANGSLNGDERNFAILWSWKDDSGANVEAYILGNFPRNENKFSFIYHRPRLSYSLEGTVLKPQCHLEDSCVVETTFTSIYKGDTTKATLLTDYNTGCRELRLFNEEGEKTRVIEFCINLQSNKFISIVMESLDEDLQWRFDYSLEAIRKSLTVVNLRQQGNPEFLGEFLFKLTGFADDLLEAGIGKLPIYDSPRFKIMWNSLKSKVLQPAHEFNVAEVKKLANDLRNDFLTLRNIVLKLLQKIPPLPELKRRLKEVADVSVKIGSAIFESVYPYYEAYFRSYLDKVDKYVATIRSKCQNNEDCRTLVHAYNEGGWRGLLNQLRVLIRSLPEKLQDFLDDPSEDVKNVFATVVNALKDKLQPLTEYRCGEIIVKVALLSKEAAEPHMQRILAKLPDYYRVAKQFLSSNPTVLKLIELGKSGFLRLQQRVKQVDYRKLYNYAEKCLEDYLTSLSPPSLKHVFVVNSFDMETAIIDTDVHTGIGDVILFRIVRLSLALADRIVSIPLRYNWNTLLVKLKRHADLNFFPPYETQAMILANQHFITFDKKFYDFAGECTYLLARDFEDSNFTFALKPREGDNDPSVLVLIKDISIELNGAQKAVKVADNAVELPYLSEHFTVIRSGNTIIVDDKYGVQVKCHLIHELCVFVISGWYYGKTAGLLGTYNYEPSDDFKRPKGQIANSATVFAKSWELKKGCKTSNLVADSRINERSDYYKQCKLHFESSKSPLAACFAE
ncbi:apolipophorins-like, partial [Stegodyphus dumicola]|uniref:apolipophorins-like n=1 Tax=Stegodyphus dumicola TaxID=202533 RepID=UPI0015ABE22A